jgi:hypothetical protein
VLANEGHPDAFPADISFGDGCPAISMESLVPIVLTLAPHATRS